ncbi:phosphoribosyltransferase [Nitrosopumilus sp.]|nr:phosphoribosyltransferase [Nitrosopumilus sp.]
MAEMQEVNWNDVDEIIKKLSERILQLNRTFSSISTVSRGGLIPSRLIADALNIKKIYVDQNKISSDSLFVDDIFDSGKTFNNIFLNVDGDSKFIFATLYARRGMAYPEQLIYGEKTFDNSYVVFPWDKLEFKNTIQ